MLQSYTSEFKKKIVWIYEKQGRTYKSITAKYGVSKASISKWCSEFSKECQEKAFENPNIPNEMELMKENIRLRKELEEAKKQVGYPYDNAPMERYFNTLKNECTNLYEFETEEALY